MITFPLKLMKQLFVLALVTASTALFAAQAPAPKLLRSLSGTSGKVVGSRFVLDEAKTRFVFPQDKVVNVYFEWEFVPGEHALSATFRQPDGKVVSISPDVRIQAPDKELNCYWIFEIRPYYQPGTWTVDVRIDGRPAGTHAFELAGVEPAGDKLTLDQVFKKYAPSVVKVYKLDEAARRIDVSSGFVIADGAVATAFQAIDAAQSIEIEFADGRKTTSTEVLAVSRLGDWAVVKTNTSSIPPIPRTSAEQVPVGGLLAALVVEGDTRTITPVEVRASSTQGIYGPRVQIAQAIELASVGGPLINEQGEAVAILGGSLRPGSRIDQRSASANRWLSRTQEGARSATPIAAIPANLPPAGRSMAALAAAGVLTPPLAAMPEFVFGGAVPRLSKDLSEVGVGEQIEYSMRGDPEIAVYSNWIKRAKLSKGEISITVANAENAVRLTTPPKKVTLRDQEQRISIVLSTKGLGLGYFRVDVCWDGKPAWRTYVRVVD